MKFGRAAVLAGLLFWGSGGLAHALLPLFTTTYEFQSSFGQPTVFDGSTITIGVPLPGLGRPNVVTDYDIKDPNAAGGEIIAFDLVNPNFIVFRPDTDPNPTPDITSALSTGWTGQFEIQYTKVGKGMGELIVTRMGSTGNINDLDPISADGTWTALPDQAGTFGLLGLAMAVLGSVRFLQGREVPPLLGM